MPKEVILNLLSRTSKHMSAKEIHATLYRMHPRIGLTTISRTLDLLYRMGLIYKLDIVDGHTRYEFRSGEKKEHHHLICPEC
ncbi:MAG: hypothetical protein B5M54_07550 [Candidatus Aminicenantes bacterium 4484_214]|nr:MAG: hypothetical protein B5M54_07550 [Candidatus Aminicenantes bacterium 4484_214]RLE09647.1 MAG: hypothetical protein DRJ06_02485 [Candidatus Aminicenantes bacterium]